MGGLGSVAPAQAPAIFPVEPNGQILFVMPSRNIGCIYTPAGGTADYKPFDGGPELVCDRVAPDYVRLALTPTTFRRYNDVADRDCCDGLVHVFAYGTRWTQGPFVCDSAPSGLSCRRQDGRGFLMNRSNVVAR
ncbi:MAG: hypothetical protein IT536_01620 [Hyphomicrobiales bacterium]|nr:hypothetical protein [Hyphomicrobiales bacterium]